MTIPSPVGPPAGPVRVGTVAETGETMRSTLPKPTLTARSTHIREMTDARDALNAALAAYNERVSAEFAKVRAAIDAFNATIEGAAEFCGEVAQDIRAEFEDKGDRWLESPRGQAYENWAQEWDNTPDAVDIDEPDELEIDTYALDDFEQLPTQVDP